MKFIQETDGLIVQLQGWEKLWALKSRLEIPRSAIAEVDFVAEQPVMQDFRGFLRLPGTSIPWHFLAGSYRRGNEREFWYVRLRQAGMLTIELRPDSPVGYDRLRLSCDPETAQAIADWQRGASVVP